MNDSVALLELKKKSQKLLRKISEETSINSERAKALLLLSTGASQQEAAEQTSLSLGQVRYWLGRYRANGISCFPETIKVKKDKEKPEKNKKVKAKKDKSKKDKKAGKKSKSAKKSK